MDKQQAIDTFWNSFGIPAYDENSVPDDAVMPYITYNVISDSLDSVVNLYANLWYSSMSWKDISLKSEEIAERIVKMNPPSIAIDNGRLYLAKGKPFAQRMSEPEDDKIRRIYINVQAEFLTAY